MGGGQTLFAKSIHDMHPDGYLAFDLRDVLEIFEGSSPLNWVVTDLDDFSGGDIAEVVYQRHRAEGSAFLVRDTFSQFANDIDQTYQGTFIAFPAAIPPNEALEHAADDKFFTGPAVAWLMAVDSSYWVAILKDRGHHEALVSKFHDIREEDPYQWIEPGGVT